MNYEEDFWMSIKSNFKKVNSIERKNGNRMKSDTVSDSSVKNNNESKILLLSDEEKRKEKRIVFTQIE